MKNQSIQHYMSENPLTIGQDQTLLVAHRFMRKHKVRHLPVLAGGKLVGILSQRDLYLLETFDDIDQNEVKVSEAMSPDPLTVTPTAPLLETIQAMAENKYGSVVVLENGRVVGIFTLIDALNVFTKFLQKQS